MPPAAVCHLSAAGTPTASWFSAFSGANAACNCLPPQRRGHSNRVLVLCQSAVDASCGCLPPQRRGHSNRVLVQCPVGLPMPPAAVCHLSAAGTPTASWSSAQSGCQCRPAAVCNLSAAGTPTASWHGDHAHKYSRGIPAWRRGHLSTLWHGDPQQNHFCGRVTWQDCLEPVSNRSLADASAGLRHDIPCERPLGGIPAWRSGHLSTLWHGDPQQSHFWGRVTWQACLKPVLNRSLADASA